MSGNERSNERLESGAPAAEIPVDVFRPAAGFVKRYRSILGGIIVIVTSLVWFLRLAGAGSHLGRGDTWMYQKVADTVMEGKLPYQDCICEYPPFAIPFFLLPQVLFGRDHYASSFALFAILADCLVKCLLLFMGLRECKTSRALLPVLVYSLSIFFLRDFIFLRYDLWPTLVCVVAIWLFCSGFHLLSGVAIAVGIGLKVYPVVFVPPLFVLAFRQQKGPRFLAGLAAGLLPIALLSFALPWWRFAQYQSARRLQVESLYASVLWVGKRLGLVQVNWQWGRSVKWGWNQCYEIRGPMASAVLPWAKVLFMATVASSTAFGCWAAAYSDTKLTLGRVSRLLLVPLLGFVTFNVAISPQYMIWLLSLAALGTLDGSRWPVLAIIFATMLTPVFYPSPEYQTGLDLFESIALLCRNLILIFVFVRLIVEFVKSSAPYKRKFARPALI